MPGDRILLPSAHVVVRDAVVVFFRSDPELDVALLQDFHHERVNLFSAEVLLVSDYPIGSEGCCVMCPQDLFDNVREVYFVWVREELVIEFKQMIGISVQPQPLSPVILIEVLPVVGVEESDVKLLDQLKAVILRLAEICIISPKGDNELFPHTGELAPSGDDSPIELRKGF